MAGEARFAPACSTAGRQKPTGKTSLCSLQLDEDARAKATPSTVADSRCGAAGGREALALASARPRRDAPSRPRGVAAACWVLTVGARVTGDIFFEIIST